MSDIIRIYLPWLLSAITIYMTVLAGNKTRWAWAIGLVNQALWLVWIVTTATWGLLPMNLALWVVYSRNHLKWMKADKPIANPYSGLRQPLTDAEIMAAEAQFGPLDPELVRKARLP